MKILIVGGTGLIAEAIFRMLIAETDSSVVLLTRTPFENEINRRIIIYSIPVFELKLLKDICYTEKPDIIINTAGLSDILHAENDKKLAQNLNVVLVENLIRISKVIEAHFIQFSTDMIFDGRKGPYSETDLPNPLNYLGKTKLSAENLCKPGHNKTTILRTSLVFGKTSFARKNFILDTIKELEWGNDVFLSQKIKVTPSYCDDIALAVLKVISKSKYGIYNLSGSDVVSLFDIGLLLANIFALDESKVKPLLEPAAKLKIPEKCGLINLKAETDLNMKFSGFENSLTALKFHQHENKLNYYHKPKEFL